MKASGWLSAKKALDWCFVDEITCQREQSRACSCYAECSRDCPFREITNLADEPAPKLTDDLASAVASEGMPIPNIPIADAGKDGLFAKLLAVLTSLFNSKL